MELLSTCSALGHHPFPGEEKVRLDLGSPGETQASRVSPREASGVLLDAIACRGRTCSQCGQLVEERGEERVCLCPSLSWLLLEAKGKDCPPLHPRRQTAFGLQGAGLSLSLPPGLIRQGGENQRQVGTVGVRGRILQQLLILNHVRVD